MNEEKLYNVITKTDDDLLDRSLNRKAGSPKKSIFAVTVTTVLIICLMLILIPVFRQEDIPVNDPSYIAQLRNYPVTYSPNHDLPKPTGNYSFSSFSYDWMVYSTVGEIIDASTDIYSGIVTGISFEIIDMETGKADRSPDSVNTDRMLNTIYTVEVTESYKGEAVPVKKISIDGGLRGYNEKEQYDLMDVSGLLKKWPGIPVDVESPFLTIGSEYLFCTVHGTGDYDHIIQPDQFSYIFDSEGQIRSETAKAIIKCAQNS